MAWLGIWFFSSNTCGGVWLNRVRQNWKIDKKDDEDCVEEGFQLAKAKYNKDGEGGREALVVRNCGINIWDGLELKLAWSKKSSSYIENNFPIFLLSGISNTSISKVSDVLHRVHFLETKTFSNSFRSLIIFYIHFFSIIANKFYLD